MAGKDMSVYEEIGQRIRDVRASKGMSQSELAECSGISLPHISRIEYGRSEMLIVTLIKVAEALQVSTDTLLRPNIPEVKNQYDVEFTEMFSDCTPKEIEAIFRIVKELKTTMHDQRKTDDE